MTKQSLSSCSRHENHAYRHHGATGDRRGSANYWAAYPGSRAGIAGNPAFARANFRGDVETLFASREAGGGFTPGVNRISDGKTDKACRTLQTSRHIKIYD